MAGTLLATNGGSQLQPRQATRPLVRSERLAALGVLQSTRQQWVA